TGDVHVIAPAAGSNVVDNPAAGRGQFHTAEEMHQNSLTGAAPANNPQDLFLSDLKRDILQYPLAIKVHAEVIDRDQWSLHNTLVPNVAQVAYYLLYDVSLLSRSQIL